MLFMHSSHADDIKYGLWELSFNMQMDGMPFSIPIPVVNVKQCVRAEDTIPKFENNSKDCDYIDQKKSGGTVTWKIKCTKTNLQGEGKITYTGISMHGTVSSQIDKIGRASCRERV